jgi:tripartite-type tricarboxylate transporter receptor subunit TctC
MSLKWVGGLGALAVAAMAAATLAYAQADYPNRPIKIVVGFSPGGPSDIVARIVGVKMAELMGQQLVVENRTGAGGLIANEMVARSAPDGYTLLNTATSVAVNETLSKTIKVEFGKDLMAVALQADTANILVVHPSLGVKNFQEFLALARSKPGEINFASAGRGTATHLSGEMFNMMAGTKMVAVHYRGGGDTLKDLVSGQVKVMFSSIAPVAGLVREGKLLAFGTTGPKRDFAFPDLPTIAELGIAGYEMRLWVGMTAPAGTPPAIIKKIEQANNAALRLPEVQKALAAQGFAPLIGTAEEFDVFYRKERDKFARLVKAAGLDKD